MTLENLAASALCGFAKLLTGVRAVWRGNLPEGKQQVYFANHRSHGDFVLIWASLPPPAYASAQSPAKSASACCCPRPWAARW